MQLKIVSLNIAGYKNWEERKQNIVNFLNQEKPDVLFLQEVKFDPTKSPYNQSAILNDLLNQPFPYSQATVSKFYQPSTGSAFREGLAVLSKYNITSSEALVLVKQSDDKHPRIIQNADLSINNRQVGITNAHLSNNHHSAAQLAEILTILEARNDRRIIAGDFNILDLTVVEHLYAKNYTSSLSYKSYISFPSEGLTLDYALLPKEFTLSDLTTTEGLSDHAALTFLVTLPTL